MHNRTLRSPRQVARAFLTTPTRLLAAIFVLAGCSDAMAPGSISENNSTETHSRADRTQSATQAAEARSIRIAGQLPGFGGYYFDSDGNLVAYLTDLRQAGTARALLEPLLRGRIADAGQKRSARPEVQFREGRYDFPQLAGWRDRMLGPVLDLEGVVFLDLDEAANRLAVGVDRARFASTQQAVGRLLADLGIPLASTIYVTASAQQGFASSAKSSVSASSTGTLQSYTGDLIAGVQIKPNGLGECTLGPVLQLNGVTRFLTNSHCSPYFWATDRNDMYMPTDWGAFIGEEYYDKGGDSCGFLSSRLCRQSDMAVYTVRVSERRGNIARTTGFAEGSWGVGSIEIDQNNPLFKIVAAEYNHPAVGDLLNKVGRSTGWTRGIVSRTCVERKTDYSDRILRCQDHVYMGAAFGDSGSPVFKVNSDGTAILYGMLWGFDSSTGEVIYGGVLNIHQDLGLSTNMVVTAPY
ncbi:MAG TPA: hypothetical protein VK399_17645 [Longimicrobiaceae bacterium]|nr:hypothetical protein [Longimicrobiaceae bacterium]